MYITIIPENDYHFISSKRIEKVHKRNNDIYDFGYEASAKEEVCITRESEYQPENLEEAVDVTNHLHCNILRVNKSYIPKSSHNRSRFYAKEDISEVQIEGIKDFTVLYNGFMSFLADENTNFPPTKATYVIDSLEKMNEFEKNCNIIDFTHSKYLNLGNKESPVTLDYSKYNLILCINTTDDGSRAFGYSVKQMFIVENEIMPIYDYHNQSTIINAAESPYPVKVKHVYITLMKVDKTYIPKECKNKS